MKSIFIAILIIPCIACGIDFGGGAKAGISFTQFWGNDALQEKLDTDFLAGFTAGGFAGMFFSDAFGFEPGLAYCMRGAKNEAENAVTFYVETERRVRLHYIDIPLLAKLIIPMEFPVRPFASAGLSMSFLVGAKGRREDTSGDVKTHDVKDDYVTFELGVPLGAGVLIGAGPGDILVEFQFRIGLTSVDSEEPNTERKEMRNRGFSFLCGYSL
jgi:hypothetical protein